MHFKVFLEKISSLPSVVRVSAARPLPIEDKQINNHLCYHSAIITNAKLASNKITNKLNKIFD